MAVSLFHLDSSLHLITAYENGAVVLLRANLHAGEWIPLYKSQAHSQPILSFDVSPCFTHFITSGADAIIAKHPIPRGEPCAEEDENNSGKPPEKVRGPQHAQETPMKTVNTKHAGQQGLKIRSDGSIFATAGWDSKVRVYSAKSLKEVAVLKWHKSGCYVTAFASLHATQATQAIDASLRPADDSGGAKGTAAVSRTSGDAVTGAQITSPAFFDVKQRRINHAKTAHWIAAGSKDGKVSLWDIY